MWQASQSRNYFCESLLNIKGDLLMKRYDELLFERFNEDWSKLTPKQMLSLLQVKI